MSNTVKDSTPTAVTVSDRMRELIEEMIDDQPCRFDHDGFCQEHASSSPCWQRRARHVLGLDPFPDPAEERLEGWRCNGCDRVVAQHEIDAGKEVCACRGDFVQVKASLPQTLGEEEIPVTRKIEYLRGELEEEGWEWALPIMDAVADERSRLLTALEEKEKELAGEQWQCRRVADFLEIANRRHHESQQEVQRLTLANLSLLEASVLQKEELEQVKAQLANTQAFAREAARQATEYLDIQSPTSGA